MIECDGCSTWTHAKCNRPGATVNVKKTDGHNGDSKANRSTMGRKLLFTCDRCHFADVATPRGSAPLPATAPAAFKLILSRPPLTDAEVGKLEFAPEVLPKRLMDAETFCELLVRCRDFRPNVFGQRCPGPSVHYGDDEFDDDVPLITLISKKEDESFKPCKPRTAVGPEVMKPKPKPVHERSTNGAKGDFNTSMIPGRRHVRSLLPLGLEEEEAMLRAAMRASLEDYPASLLAAPKDDVGVGDVEETTGSPPSLTMWRDNDDNHTDAAAATVDDATDAIETNNHTPGDSSNAAVEDSEHSEGRQGFSASGVTADVSPSHVLVGSAVAEERRGKDGRRRVMLLDDCSRVTDLVTQGPVIGKRKASAAAKTSGSKDLMSYNWNVSDWHGGKRRALKDTCLMGAAKKAKKAQAVPTWLTLTSRSKCSQIGCLAYGPRPLIQPGEQQVLSHVLSPEMTKAFRSAQAKWLAERFYGASDSKASGVSGSKPRHIAELLTPVSSIPELEGFDADAKIRAVLQQETPVMGNTANAQLESLPVNLPPHTSLETFTVPDLDPRVGLHGQYGLRVKVRVPKHSVIGAHGCWVGTAEENIARKLEAAALAVTDMDVKDATPRDSETVGNGGSEGVIKEQRNAIGWRGAAAEEALGGLGCPCHVDLTYEAMTYWFRHAQEHGTVEHGCTAGGTSRAYASGLGPVANCIGYANICAAINDFRVDPLGLLESEELIRKATRHQYFFYKGREGQLQLHRDGCDARSRPEGDIANPVGEPGTKPNVALVEIAVCGSAFLFYVTLDDVEAGQELVMRYPDGYWPHMRKMVETTLNTLGASRKKRKHERTQARRRGAEHGKGKVPEGRNPNHGGRHVPNPSRVVTNGSRGAVQLVRKHHHDEHNDCSGYGDRSSSHHDVYNSTHIPGSSLTARGQVDERIGGFWGSLRGRGGDVQPGSTGEADKYAYEIDDSALGDFRHRKYGGKVVTRPPPGAYHLSHRAILDSPPRPSVVGAWMTAPVSARMSAPLPPTQQERERRQEDIQRLSASPGSGGTHSRPQVGSRETYEKLLKWAARGSLRKAGGSGAPGSPPPSSSWSPPTHCRQLQKPMTRAADLAGGGPPPWLRLEVPPPPLQYSPIHPLPPPIQRSKQPPPPHGIRQGPPPHDHSWRHAGYERSPSHLESVTASQRHPSHSRYDPLPPPREIRDSHREGAPRAIDPRPRWELGGGARRGGYTRDDVDDGDVKWRDNWDGWGVNRRVQRLNGDPRRSHGRDGYR